LTIASLCIGTAGSSRAAAAALLEGPSLSDPASTDNRDALFEPALARDLSADPWVAVPNDDQYDITTTLDPFVVRPAEESSTAVDSGKSVFQTQEPSGIVMFSIGAGLVVIALPRHRAHRRGRRKVRVSDRLMAQI
jgi:hypothetical protein